MGKKFDIKATFEIQNDNTERLKEATEEQIAKALEKIGLQAQANATIEIESAPARVDTGRLRASIVYATEDSTGTPRTPEPRSGRPAGELKGGDSTPHGKPEHGAVYVGTNVEYAIYVHEGTSRMSPNRFLRNAFSEHMDDYDKIIQQVLDEIKI